MLWRALALALFAVAVASCTSGGTIADMVPHALGGLPKNAPPRPGTPEYEDYRKRIEGQTDPKTEPMRLDAPTAGQQN
jgi:hypothetical protein